MFKKKCPRCGAKNDKARMSCIECGAPFLLVEEERAKGVSVVSAEKATFEREGRHRGEVETDCEWSLVCLGYNLKRLFKLSMA